MDVPETHTDLLQADVAVLATLGTDGRPQVSLVWFVADEEAIRISLNTARQKVKNLRAHPATTVVIIDRQASTRYLEIRGDADVTEDDGYTFADQVGQKYGVDLRGFDGDNPHRVVVTIRPTRVRAVDMTAGG
jgi:PPOX class probable F420-dependent enzyme